MQISKSSKNVEMHSTHLLHLKRTQNALGERLCKFHRSLLSLLREKKQKHKTQTVNCNPA